MDHGHTQKPATSLATESRKRTGAKLWTGLALLAAIAGVVAVVGPRLSHDAPVQAAAFTAPVVTVAQPIQRQINGRLQFLGQFSAVDSVELRAQVGGRLTYIGFKDGDIVRSGALLFVIDPTPYQIRMDQATARVANAQARLALAVAELNRAQTLQRTDAGTTENVDQRQGEQRSAQASLDEAEAQVRDAKFDLDHTRVYAPFSGRMGTHLVSVGNLVAGDRDGGSATTLLATIVSVDPVYLNFDMSEADYLVFERERASRGSEVSNHVGVSLSDENRFTRQGTLNFIDNALDRSSGTIHARATVPNPDLLLTPGAFGRVRVSLSKPRQVLLIPDTAVSADQADRVVMVVGADGLVKPSVVQTGELRYGMRVVYAGLSPAGRVIIGGPPVRPGTKVTTQDGAIALGSDEGSN